MESAFWSYILLNFIINMSTHYSHILERGAYRDMKVFRGMVRQEMQGMDFGAQQITHRKFWEGGEEGFGRGRRDDRIVNVGRTPFPHRPQQPSRIPQILLLSFVHVRYGRAGVRV